MNHPVSKTGMSTCQPFDLPVQGRFVGPVSPAVSQHRTRPPQDVTNLPLRDPITLAQVIGGCSLLVGAHHFFFAMSWSIVLSRSSSATNFLSRSTWSFQLAAPAIAIDLVGIAFLSPAIIHRLTDAVLATDVGNGQSLGQIAVRFLEQPCNLFGGPSPSWGPLRVGLLLSPGVRSLGWTTFWGAGQQQAASQNTISACCSNDNRSS